MTQLPTVVLASRNAKKIGEMRDLLEPYGIPLVSVSEFEDVSEVMEDGDTFQSNAEKKAREVAQATSHWAIGEDSGLRVDALNGAPGVYSARYSGPDATDELNNEKLMVELKGVTDDQRGAEYVCHVAVADPSGTVRLNIEALCRGRIAHEAHGSNGFGYDPYFQIREYHRTFGELPPIIKRQLSHRARAFNQLLPKLVRILSES
ncbi:Non-canonical purine NTP pyrophosphatase [Thalassoglobus neptunius]|uniref:dITP/XTP pyrophosphatase n=1 Tax=Thalassoglobus neptunius TaxID=1938619 RepID=A0A5C5VRD5_9PLAN|nr:RdgB/HAM1 family non-canonical purine NTP pyrophosphatase [Thalassoglobus neptunius]TWT40730.1 Non-canonical purine NTP pyrophosphatase [Thalassoglobus neptunius]